VCNRTMDVPCLLTALLFFLSNGLNILLRSKQFNGDKDNGGQYTYAQFLELDSEYLAQKWQDRYDMRGLMTCANLFNAMAWFLLCIPILQVAWILSRAGKRRLGLHVSIALLTLCGSLTELVSRLMTIGMYNIGLYLVSRAKSPRILKTYACPSSCDFHTDTRPLSPLPIQTLYYIIYCSNWYPTHILYCTVGP
jgi:hypothetical protein